MKEIMNIVINTLTMVGVFLIPMVLVRFADILFGILIANKTINQIFEFKKLARGIITSLGFMIALGSLVSGFCVLPYLLTYYNIDFIDLTKFEYFSNYAIIFVIVTVTIVTYGKDAFAKFKTLLNFNQDVEIVNQRGE